MPLGREVSLGPGHIVLYVDPAPPKRGIASPPFCPCLLWPNGWMDQDTTWYCGRPRPRPHCVRWRPSLPERGTAARLFSAHMSIVAKRSPISATAEQLLRRASGHTGRQTDIQTYRQTRSSQFLASLERGGHAIIAWSRGTYGQTTLYDRLPDCGPIPTVMAAQPNVRGALC